MVINLLREMPPSSPVEVRGMVDDPNYAPMGERMFGKENYKVSEAAIDGGERLRCELRLTKLPDLHRGVEYKMVRLLNVMNRDRLSLILSGEYQGKTHGSIGDLEVEATEVQLFWQLIEEYKLPVGVAGFIAFNCKDYDLSRLKKPSKEINNTVMAVVCGEAGSGKTTLVGAMSALKGMEVATLDHFSGVSPGQLVESGANSLDELISKRKNLIAKRSTEKKTVTKMMREIVEKFENWGKYRPKCLLFEGIAAPDDSFGVSMTSLMTMEGFEVQFWIENGEVSSVAGQLAGVGLDNVALPIPIDVPRLTNANIDYVYQIIGDAVNIVAKRYMR